MGTLGSVLPVQGVQRRGRHGVFGVGRSRRDGTETVPYLACTRRRAAQTRGSLGAQQVAARAQGQSLGEARVSRQLLQPVRRVVVRRRGVGPGEEYARCADACARCMQRRARIAASKGHQLTMARRILSAESRGPLAGCTLAVCTCRRAGRACQHAPRRRQSCGSSHRRVSAQERAVRAL